MITSPNPGQRFIRSQPGIRTKSSGHSWEPFGGTVYPQEAPDYPPFVEMRMLWTLKDGTLRLYGYKHTIIGSEVIDLANNCFYRPGFDPRYPHPGRFYNKGVRGTEYRVVDF